ncbi:MAG TPA: hypothetical protein VE398_05410 [Acidobacteriota bacterium]|nr:hypothetical protein [Acidobacteriota bacterium]
MNWAGLVLVPALDADILLAPVASSDMIIAEASGAFGALPGCFMETACTLTFHGEDATRKEQEKSIKNRMPPDSRSRDGVQPGSCGRATHQFPARAPK